MNASHRLNLSAAFLQRLAPTMQGIYSHGQLWRIGGLVHLAHLGSGWCVIDPRYICAVVDCDQGRRLMAALKAEGERLGVPIEYEQRG